MWVGFGKRGQRGGRQVETGGCRASQGAGISVCVCFSYQHFVIKFLVKLSKYYFLIKL